MRWLCFFFIFLMTFAHAGELVDIDNYHSQAEAKDFLIKNFSHKFNREEIQHFLDQSKNGKLKVLLGDYIFNRMKNLNDSILQCGLDRSRRQCWYGVMSAFASLQKSSKTSEQKFLSQIFESKCLEKNEKNLLAVCVHGLGHAFFEYKGNIDSAVKLCGDARIPFEYTSFCESGVFNRYFLQQKVKILNNGRINSEPCKNDSYFKLCLKYKVLAGKDEWPQIENKYDELCNQLGNNKYDCYMVIGGSLEVEKLKNGKKQFKDLCLKDSLDHRWACIKTVIRTFIHEVGTRSEAEKQCKALTPSELQKKCTQFLDEGI